MSIPAAVDEETSLADWIRAHGVAWEMPVRSEGIHGQRTSVGLALTLAAQCLGHCRTDPACPACQGTQQKLREIALAVIPDGVTPWFDPLEPSFHMRRAADWAPEVEVTVVLRAAPPAVALDAAVADTIRDRLQRMGARPRT